MSKTQQAKELFRANNQATAKEVAEKVGISVAHAYTIRRAVVGPVYRHKKKRARVQTEGQKVVVEMIKNEAKVADQRDKIIEGLQNEISLLMTEVEDSHTIIRYLEKRIAASV